jgi:hypothetical protein
MNTRATSSCGDVEVTGDNANYIVPESTILVEF